MSQKSRREFLKIVGAFIGGSIVGGLTMQYGGEVLHYLHDRLEPKSSKQSKPPFVPNFVLNPDLKASDIDICTEREALSPILKGENPTENIEDILACIVPIFNSRDYENYTLGQGVVVSNQHVITVDHALREIGDPFSEGEDALIGSLGTYKYGEFTAGVKVLAVSEEVDLALIKTPNISSYSLKNESLRTPKLAELKSDREFFNVGKSIMGWIYENNVGEYSYEYEKYKELVEYIQEYKEFYEFSQPEGGGRSGSPICSDFGEVYGLLCKYKSVYENDRLSSETAVASKSAHIKSMLQFYLEEISKL